MGLSSVGNWFFLPLPGLAREAIGVVIMVVLGNKVVGLWWACLDELQRLTFLMKLNRPESEKMFYPGMLLFGIGCCTQIIGVV